jgi:hypothetical protein
MKNKMEKELIKAKKKAIELERQLEKLPQEEPVNLCPECSFFCEQRFIDGQCK